MNRLPYFLFCLDRKVKILDYIDFYIKTKKIYFILQIPELKKRTFNIKIKKHIKIYEPPKRTTIDQYWHAYYGYFKKHKESKQS